jgi:inhibitor of KinA sporulation pathway (predicted exonuclease)
MLNLTQIGQITMDNTSNCNTLMEHLEILLQEHNIPFHQDGNHIQSVLNHGLTIFI